MDRQILNKDKELMKQQRFLYNYKQKKVQFTYYEKLINILIFRMSNLIKFGYLPAKQSVFLLCDLQEKFRPIVSYFKEVLHGASRLVSILNVF